MARAKTIPVTSRETFGVGSVRNTHHEGVSKRPTETRKHLDEVTSEDIGKSIKPESPMANPSFGGGGKEKG